MSSELGVVLPGLILFLIGLMIWCSETYSDAEIAVFWRDMSSDFYSKRGASIRRLAWTLFAISSGTGILLETAGAPHSLVFIIAILGLLFLLIAVLYFLPLPVPHCIDAQWQWHKRHGLIDENGKIIPPTPHQTNYCSYALGGETVTIKTSMELPDTWRALSLPNPKAILTPQIPPIVNATSAHPRSPLDDALFVAVGIPEKTTGFRPNFIVTIDLMGESPIPLDEIIAGWMTIEETRFPIPSDDTLMTTGLYVDEGLSYTAIQWTWTQVVSNRTVRLYATATATTTSINSIADQLPRMLETLQVIS
ncbi:hypothetical protein [Actinomyces sp.]